VGFFLVTGERRRLKNNAVPKVVFSNPRPSERAIRSLKRKRPSNPRPLLKQEDLHLQPDISTPDFVNEIIVETSDHSYPHFVEK
jgi:hypothetical protein